MWNSLHLTVSLFSGVSIPLKGDIHPSHEQRSLNIHTAVLCADQTFYKPPICGVLIILTHDMRLQYFHFKGGYIALHTKTSTNVYFPTYMDWECLIRANYHVHAHSNTDNVQLILVLHTINLHGKDTRKISGYLYGKFTRKFGLI